MKAIKEAAKALLGALKAAGTGAMKAFKETPAGLITKIVATVGGAIASAWMYIKHIKRQHRDITDYDDSELSPVEMIQKRNMIYDRHVNGLSKKERRQDRYQHDVSKFRMDQEVASVLRKLRKGKSLTKEDRDILRDFEYYSKGDFHFDGDKIDLDVEDEFFNPRAARQGKAPRNFFDRIWDEQHGLNNEHVLFGPIDPEENERIYQENRKLHKGKYQKPDWCYPDRQLKQPRWRPKYQ